LLGPWQKWAYQPQLEPGPEIFPGAAPPSALLLLLVTGNGELQAGGWNSQSSTQGELGKGILQPSTPAPFPPPSHSVARV
jgi:hypothetical protein